MADSKDPNDRKITARAVVTMTIQFDLDDVWGNDCAVAQIQKQAKDSAVNSIDLWMKQSRKNVRIHGIKVESVITREDGRG